MITGMILRPNLWKKDAYGCGRQKIEKYSKCYGASI